jgi:uncharacterized protein
MNKASDADFTREDADFVSEGLRCSAWLYRPSRIERPPIVLMAHGFGAEKTFGLEPFAEAFVRAGLAVLLFDYRCFGGSEGEPRNWVSPGRHIQDYEAALAHAKTLPGIDPKRIGLWGTSFSGAHVIVLASRHPEVSAVVAQVPMVDGWSVFLNTSPRKSLKLTPTILRDLGRAVMGHEPALLPLVGEPFSGSIMDAPGDYEGYMRLVPPDTTWRNACPARAALSAILYRAVRHAGKVRCPVLLMMAAGDQVVPARSVRKAVSRFSHGELVSLDCKHFDPYVGEWFERACGAERDFLVKNLASR